MPRGAATAISASEARALFADLRAAKALVLAVSGGPDSTALMVLMARWRKALKRGPDLIAVTVDHGLRAASKREARDVARLAKELGLTHRIVRWTGLKPKTGIPQAARQARYRLLAQAARKAGATHVLTAHTRDDQAETVVMRLARGSGLSGLAGMRREASLPLSSPSPLEGEGRGGGYVSNRGFNNSPPSRRAARGDLPLKGGGERKDGAAAIILLRPLLEVPKARLIATLEAAGVGFADDPTNRDAAFTRARLRNLMPQLAAEGLGAARLAVLAGRLRRAEAALEAVLDVVWHGLAAGPARGPLTFNAADLARLPGEIRLRLIGRALDRLGTEGPVELGKLEALVEALDEALDEVLGEALNGGIRWRRSLAGALVTLQRDNVTVETAPPRRSGNGGGRRNALTKGRPKGAAAAKSR
ncbi:MAG: tRNA lysidine(34) synthetase TilS [Pseudolabrys sp.]|nr:tRNA lysidine(34) synthetase TilS [Pseudolabrys sp.]